MSDFRILNIPKERLMLCDICGAPVPLNDARRLCFKCRQAEFKRNSKIRKIYDDASHDVELEVIVVAV